MINKLNFYHYVGIAILIVGLICGIYLGNEYTTYRSDFNVQVMFYLWIGSFILSVFIFGIGSIINKLESMFYINLKNDILNNKNDYIENLEIEGCEIICPKCKSKCSLDSSICYMCSTEFKKEK